MIMPAGQPEEPFTQDELDELNRRLAEMSQMRNMTPDPEMGNLSPDQVYQLLYTEWGQPGAAIQFNTNLPLSDLEVSVFFARARSLLLAIHGAGGVKATSGKNLPRRFVSEMVDMLLNEKERERVWRYNKVLNEQDVWAVHIPRVVAQSAGLLRLYKGKFVVPKKHARLLNPESAGVLYRDLFVAFFRRFNLAYLMGYGPEASPLQTGVPYTLYRLGTVASQWREVVDLSDDLTLPGIRTQIEEEVGESGRWTIGVLVTLRILKPLVKWGILEGRYTTDKYGYETLEAVRTAPLYGALLGFEVYSESRPPFA